MEETDMEPDSGMMEVDAAGAVSMDTNVEEKAENQESANSQFMACAGAIADSSSISLQSGPNLQPSTEPGVPEMNRTQSWTLPEGTCRKQTLITGEGLYGPGLSANCSVTFLTSCADLDPSITGYALGQGSVTLGEGGTPVSTLLDQALMCMKRGETSEVVIAGIPGLNKEVVFRVTLHDFVSQPPSWRLTPMEKCALAKDHKEKGSHFFKDGNVYAAFAQFRLAIRLLLSILPFSFADDDAMEKSYQQLLCACYLNLAACQMKTGHREHVITNCTLALEIDPTNVKALYRRASAHVQLGNCALAQEDLQTGMRVEPRNKALIDLLQSVSEQQALSQAPMAHGLSKMFS